MNTTDALLACLPPYAYDRQAVGVRAEATSAASVIDTGIGKSDTLLREQQPDRTLEALPDWERNYGLPDTCCATGSGTEAERRSNLLGRFRGRGNMSIAYLLAEATRLGYPGCTITEISPGSWRLNVPMTTAVVLMTCESPCDNALRTWGNTQLECLMRRLKPAHTTPLFAYS